MKRKLIVVLVVSVLASLVGRAQPQVVVWGVNSYGQANVPADATNVIALAAGDNHCLALRTNGTVVAWGGNSFGQTDVPVDLTNAVGVAAGSAHSLALRSDGTIALWGRIMPSGVTSVPATATNLVALALGSGAQHAVALRADGTVVDWGNSSYGLTNIPSTAVAIVSVAAGSFHSLALRSDGRVVAWGDNSQGQINVPAAATNIVAIATGWYDNAALRADGTMLVWGAISPPSPSLGFTNIVDLVCPFNALFGPNAVLALRRDGTLVQWQGTSVPMSARTNIAAIAAGSYNGFAAIGSGAPVFPARPIDRTVPSGARAYFRMNAVGALPLLYQWNCNGTNIPGATNPVLTLTNVQPALAGNYYTLTAANALGTNTSGAMDLGVVPLELFIKATNSSAVIGATLAFSSSVIGQGPFSYQWQFNGTNLLGATSTNLALANVQIADAGRYSLIASNSFGFATNSVVLSVSPTIVTKAPSDQFSFPGGSATFSMNLQTMIPIVYRWRFNGVDLPGATGNALLLSNLNYAQAGTYSVVFSNAFEVVTNSATLRVSPVAAWGANTSAQANPPDGLTNIIATSAGSAHSVTLDNSGHVTVWGGDSVRRAVPLDLTNALAISAGNWGTLALRSDGSVASWGYSIGGFTNAPTNATNIVAISAGDYHNLALKADGTLVGWGQNISGESTPPEGLTNVVAISAGSQFSMALKDDGHVVAWGYNGNGQTNVPASLSNVVAVAAGAIHCIALRADGTVAVWGSSSYGLQTIPAAATNIVAIAAGYGHCLALRADGAVVAWGYSYNGETTIPTGLKRVAGISAGRFHSLALVSDSPLVLLPVPTVPTSTSIPVTNVAGGTVRFAAAGNGAAPVSYQWQFNGTNLPGATNASLWLDDLQMDQAGTYSVTITNRFGTPGTSAVSFVVVPFIIEQQPASLITIPGVTATFTTAIQAIAPVSYQWQFNGSDVSGETNNTLVVTNVRSGQIGVYSVTITNHFGVARSADAALALSETIAWGYNNAGQTNMLANLTNVVAISAGGYHNLALKADGTIVTWGADAYDGGLTNVLAVAGGGYHSLALKPDHTVSAWGAGVVDNGYDPHRGQSIVPPDLTNVIAVAGGMYFSLALKADGTVVAWGDNAYDQCVPPASATNVIAIAAGSYHSVALKSDGTVIAWGYNANGQTDVPIVLSNVVAIAGGAYQSLAATADGTVIPWGTPVYGLNVVPAPATNVIAVACDFAGNNFALRADGGVVAWGRNSMGETNVPAILKNAVALSAGVAHGLALIGNGPSPRLAVLEHPAKQDANFGVSVATRCGRVYRFECADSVDAPDWSVLSFRPGNGQAITCTDNTATNSQRFYRVRQW